MGTRIGIVDYGVGNLGSVLRALGQVGADAQLLQHPDALAGAGHVVLPGVGHFSDCMQRLDGGGWSPALRRHAAAGRPLLGICVGMQLLASRGDEGAAHAAGTPGLGLVPGRVQALPGLGCTGRVPHVGWNIVRAHRSAPLLAQLPADTDFYFVHGFAFVPDDPADLLASTDCGVPVAAAVQRGAVLGTQFHPEKSGRAGFQVLRNFLGLAPC